MMTVMWYVRYFNCFLFFLFLISVCAAQTDLDGDGLVDVEDRVDFNPLETGRISYTGFPRIEDLDGVAQLTSASSLNLSRESIVELDPGDFEGLTNLEGLVLSGNRIETIEPGDFRGLTQLRHLYLQNNRIETIPADTFQDLENIERLLLDGNRIRQLEGGEFAGLAKLRILSLGGEIRDLRPGMFSGLQTLRELHLPGNQIGRIKPGDFDGLDSLVSVNLSSNQLQEIDDGAFGDLPHVFSLDLSDNMLSKLEAHYFTHLQSLVNLKLFDNRISDIDPEALSGLKNLQSLQLRRNDLSSFSSILLDSPLMKAIDLSSNKISKLEDGTFAGMPELQTLLLDGNMLTELNFTGASLTRLMPCDDEHGYEFGVYNVGFCIGDGIQSIVLDDTTLNQRSLTAILSEVNSISKASLTGVQFSDGGPSDLSRLLNLETLDSIVIDLELFDRYDDEFVEFMLASEKSVEIVDLDCSQDGDADVGDADCVANDRLDLLLLTQNTLRGDLDGLGGVDFRDFLTMQRNFGREGAVYSQGDSNKDGTVGFADFLILSTNFPTDIEKMPAPISVPEPNTLHQFCLLLSIALTECCHLLRRRTSAPSGQ